MAAICASPIKGTHLRITKLDECGVPVTGGTSAVVVTKGFIQVQLESEYEDGEEFFQRTADGDLCINDRDDDTLKYLSLTVDFCNVDPDAAILVWGGRLLTDGPTGTGFTVSEGTNRSRFSLEVWQRVAGAGACDPSGAQRFVYHAFPNVGSAQVGEYTVENAASTLQFIAKTKSATPLWTLGSDFLGGVNPISLEHWLFNITTEQPPTEACGATALV